MILTLRIDQPLIDRGIPRLCTCCPAALAWEAALAEAGVPRRGPASVHPDCLRWGPAPWERVPTPPDLAAWVAAYDRGECRGPQTFLVYLPDSAKE